MIANTTSKEGPNTFTISLTAEELAFVLAQFEATNVGQVRVASQNPGSGLSQESRMNAQKTLGVKRYVEIEEDGTVIVDSTLAGMLAAIGMPDALLSTTTLGDRDAEATNRGLYFASGLLMEQEQDDQGAVVLTAVRNVEALVDRLADLLAINSQPAPFADSFHLSGDIVSELPYLAAGGGAEDVEQRLSEAGIPHDRAVALAKAFTRPLRQSALQLSRFDQGDIETHAVMRLLEEVYGLWLFQPVQQAGQHLVQVIPCTGDEAKERIRVLLRDIASGSNR